MIIITLQLLFSSYGMNPVVFRSGWEGWEVTPSKILIYIYFKLFVVVMCSFAAGQLVDDIRRSNLFVGQIDDESRLASR